PSAELPSGASCPICLELFRDPVSIHCGHNFCRGCITRCWEWSTGSFPCPQCKEAAEERSLHPNPELARLLEVAKKLSLRAARGEGGCPKHREPLKFFCKEDEAFVCAVCRESRLHRAHAVLPVQEAVREYKGRIQARLQALEEDRDKLLGLREAEMGRNWGYLEKARGERRKILGEFEALRLFLEELERRLLARLENLEQDVEKRQEENVTSLTQGISHLDASIQEMEEKCQQPASRFLQDIRSTLSRLGEENFQQPTLLLPDLEERFSRFRKKNSNLEEILRSFREILMFELPDKMTVTLDPGTAHPQLAVSADGSSVSWEEAGQDEGLGTEPFVLGREGIAAGRSCWEAEVAPKGSWAVGVARAAPRTHESPEVELWSVGLCEGQLWALSSLERTPLPQIRVPGRVRVSLDYERGEVAFFDAEKRALIFVFPAASFGGDSVHPWFLVWGEGSRI
ncbi:TRI27 protein, partial [Penelope pileata]|nr:TRI27 protein [Penelope pileata]